jgi:hypothetical protein
LEEYLKKTMNELDTINEPSYKIKTEGNNDERDYLDNYTSEKAK